MNDIIKHADNTTIIPEGTDISQIREWTDTVKWPKSILEKIDPNKILEEAKHPTEMDDLHKRGLTGKNINIAIIDQNLYLEHPEYKDRIKHYEKVGQWPAGNPLDYHGSLVVGCAVGKTTGSAPDANIYYVAANQWVPNGKFAIKNLQSGHRLFNNMAIRRVLEINKTLPDKDKIRFLSCSWGKPDDQFKEESDKLFDECKKNGIMVLGGDYTKTESRPCNKFGISTKMNIDVTEKVKDRVGIPTDCKTTPYFEGGYVYVVNGGPSSTYPYLAGVFACALQNNQLFFTRQNWQDDLLEIMKETATNAPNGSKMINPSGIEQRVSELTREMENNLIKEQRLQNE